jgi:hypothetical protein
LLEKLVEFLIFHGIRLLLFKPEMREFSKHVCIHYSPKTGETQSPEGKD